MYCWRENSASRRSSCSALKMVRTRLALGDDEDAPDAGVFVAPQGSGEEASDGRRGCRVLVADAADADDDWPGEMSAE